MIVHVFCYMFCMLITQSQPRVPALILTKVRKTINEIKLKTKLILSFRSDLKNSGIFDSLFVTNKEKVTNQFMVDCYDAVSNHKNISHDDLLTFLRSKGICSSVTKEAIRSKLERQRIKIGKLRGAKKEQFLQEMFELPRQAMPIQTAHGSRTFPIPSQASATLSKEQASLATIRNESKELKIERKGLKRKIKQLDERYVSSNIKVKRLKQENTSLEIEVKKCRSTIKNQGKTIQSLNYINNTRRATLNSSKEKTKLLEKEVEVGNTRTEHLEQRTLDLQKHVTDSETEKAKMTDYINKLKEENHGLVESIEYLESLLKDDSNFSLFNDKGGLTNQAEICIMNLLSAKVGINHVGNVIQAVGKMFGRDISRTPSEKTIRNVNDRMMALSLKHISEEFTQEEETTLYTDETTKFGTKISGYHASDKEGNFWVLGLRELSNKSSQMTLDVFKQILEDIDDAAKQISPEQSEVHAGHKILSKIKNTMSDRAATEVAFNNLLTDYRNEILPDLIESWETLDGLEKDAISRMNNFFCGLHLLVGFAETAEKVLVKYEDANYDGPFGAAANSQTKHFTKKSESGVARTVRTTAKALAKGADEKSGCYRSFKNYLGEINKKEKLEKYLGNRFNILFHDAEILYYLHTDIINFLRNVHGPTNLLLKGVLADVEESRYMAGCKCLGLCSKLLTAPFWRLIEGNENIIDMNTHYLNLLVFLEEAAKDPTDFMTGASVPFPELIKKDHIYDNLITPNEGHDPTVLSLLMVMFTAWQTYLKRSVKDHLPGGKYSLSSDRLKEECVSASKHNKFPERVFGLTDSLIRHRPNATEMCNEAFIMFTNNKTSDWLEVKNETEKAALLKDAHTFGRSLRQKFQSRTKEIANRRMEDLRKKKALQEQRAAKKVKTKEKLTGEIIEYGLWQTKETVQNKLSQMKTKSAKEKAIKAQLKFRHEVLRQSSKNPNIYKLSRDKKKLPIQDLQNNLEKLIEEAAQIPETQEA